MKKLALGIAAAAVLMSAAPAMAQVGFFAGPGGVGVGVDGGDGGVRNRDNGSGQAHSSDGGQN